MRAEWVNVDREDREDREGRVATLWITCDDPCVRLHQKAPLTGEGWFRFDLWPH